MSTSTPNPGNLVGLYRGAMIGGALSKNIGVAEATGGDISAGIRATYLQAGVAAGRIDPKTLNPQDATLLGSAVTSGISRVPTVKPQAAGGILGALGTIGKIATNTAGDFANALTSLPAGAVQVADSTYKTAAELNPFNNQHNLSGPDLPGLLGNIAKSTVSDFTHFNPMHPLYPALDIAGAFSGGASLAARAGGSLARVADAGRVLNATSEADEVTRGAQALRRSPIVQKLGDVGAAVNKKLAGTERPVVPISKDVAATKGLASPAIPIANYSISPFRRLVVEKPIEKIANSRIGQAKIPGIAGDKSLSDLRAGYHIRKATNVARGRAGAGGVQNVIRDTQGFQHSMKDLLDESMNDKEALEKFNALVLVRQLAAENMTPPERLDVLDEYRNRILASGVPDVEGVAMDAKETKSIRDFYRKQTANPEFRQFFSDPTSAMWQVRDAWDQALLEGLKSLDIDPNELLNRSLGPAAHVRDKSPEELLREQPQHIQNSMNFAIKAKEVEDAIKEAHGGDVPETHLAPVLAQHLPGGTDRAAVQAKLKLVQQAIDSLRADASGEHTPRELLNNAGSTGYLPGNTLAQKVAQALPEHLGVPTHVAEPFATGGLTNYWPLEPATRSLRVRPDAGPIARSMNSLVRKPLSKIPGSPVAERKVGTVLKEFKHENIARTLRSESLGVEPFASFLQESDLASFKAGIDRRDPVMLIKHIQQREKLLAHRMIAEPLVRRLAIKNADGEVATFANEAELANQLGSIDSAKKFALISPKALQTLIQSEDAAALDMANALRTEGSMTPELLDHIDQIVAESGTQFVRDTADTVIAAKDRQIAVPAQYVDNLIKQARVIDSGNKVGHIWQAFINKWRTAVLAYMPSWLLRTSVGHGLILFLSGTWNPAHYFKAMQYFGDGFKMPLTADTKIFKGVGRESPLGLAQGSPSSDFGKIGHKMDVKNMIAPTITHAVHKIANFQRRAAFISTLNRVAKQHFAELRTSFDVPHGLLNTENLDKVITDHPEWVHQTLNEIDKVSYTFGQMAPWERRLAKNVLPFWGWYKFVSKFSWNLPLTYPGRALALARVGQIGMSNQDELGPMPDWLRASIMFDTHNLTDVHYMSMMGLNPLGDVMNPASGFQGIVNLGQMSPVIQAGLEGMGYNTMTGGLENIDPSSGIEEVNGYYVDVATGKEYDSVAQASVGASVDRFFGALARSFPEIRIGELAVTGGKNVYPESIPLIDEKPIPPSSPASVKNVSPVGLLGQYGGIAPKTYNMQKYQINLLKDIQRGITQQRKAKAKEKATK